MRINNRILISLLMLIAGSEFIARGPVRLFRDDVQWNDFLSPFIQSKVWLHGGNPYSPQELIRRWPAENRRSQFVDREAASGTLQEKRGIPTPYPPTTFVFLSPFAVLPWPYAEALWFFLNLVAAVFPVFALLQLSGAGWREPSSKIFIALSLALAPIHTGLAPVNPTVVAVAIAVAAVWAAELHWIKSSAVLMALAICLKPPIGLCVLFYYAVRGLWSTVVIALALTAAAFAIGALRMEFAGIHWLSAYLNNARRIFAAGSLADFTAADPVRFNMINLQVLVQALFGNPRLAEILSFSFAAALLIAWFRIRVRSGAKPPMLELGTLFVISLFPIYHRFYDASLLIFPLGWCLLLTRSVSARILTLIPMLAFFIPGASLLDESINRGWISSQLTSRWWWNTLIMPHEIWALIALSFVLLYFMSNKSLSTAMTAGFRHRYSRLKSRSAGVELARRTNAPMVGCWPR